MKQLIPSTHIHTHTKQNIKIIKEYQPPAKKNGKLTAAKKYMCHIGKYMSQEAASCTSRSSSKAQAKRKASLAIKEEGHT